MAAKLLHSLTDDNLDLQKQIGCMTGLLQLFDRPHILTGGRRVAATTHQSPSPGISDFNGGTLGRESNDEHIRPASTEKIPLKNIQEKQRISTESSRASYSSLSRSSSSSSLECNRAEPASFDRITFPEIPSSRQNRDLVKDSMYREIHGLSPRLHSEIINGSHANQRMHDDLKESLTVVAKFQEAPWHHNERRELLRSFSYHGSSSLISRDAPRFSYDGREVNPKSTLELKDLPRLSVDASKADSRSNFLKCMQQEFDSKVQNLHQARPPSVVAKLMGLETLPHSVSPIGTKDFTDISRPFAAKLSTSSNNLWKDPNSPRWRNTDSSMKPLSRFPIEPAPWKHTDGRRSSQKPRSRTTAEAAFPSVYSEIQKRLKDLEFTQSGKDLRALKQILEAMQSKKLLQSQKEVLGPNFTSHKDHDEKQYKFKHQARKPQIEEALASTRRNTIAARHNESPIVIMKPAKPAASVISLDGLSGVTKLQDNEFVDNRKGLSSGRAAKDLSSKSGQRQSAVTSANMKNDRTLKATQTSTRSQQLAKDGYAGSGKSSGSISPRMQQKKLELEKRARPPTPPDSSKSRRQPNKQLGESNSPGGRRRPKHFNIQESGEKLSEINVESRNLNFCQNENLVQSNASVTTSESMIYDSAEQISTIALHEEKPAEFGIVPVEYSSPVSVLDNGIHKDDSHSLMRYKGYEYSTPHPLMHSSIDGSKSMEISMDKQKDSNVVQGSSADADILGSREYGFTSEINQNKLQNIENLVQKLRLLNSRHDEAGTDYIASLCENTDPDHRYISEILLASGLLLRDLGSSLMDFQYHPSGHPVNPELFLVLEQTKASTVLKEECSLEKKNEMMIKGKLRRKLVFDTANEILARKLVSAGPSTEPWLRPLKLTRTALNAQKLLRELCSEIEALQCSSEEEDDRWKAAVCKDVMYHQSESWTDFDDEISGAVLDIERSIFKDLVNEIMIGESAGLKTKPAGRRRPSAK